MQDEHALDVFSRVLHSVQPYSLVLQPGQILIFDNLRVLHRRSAFSPLVDGSRWLRRQYAAPQESFLLHW